MKMEHTNDLTVVSKKLWNMVRVMYFMLRKSISERKLLLDLNMMMKRGKIAGKAMVHNLIFHHYNHSAAANRRSHDGSNHLYSPAAPYENEFSCSNTPSFPFHVSKRKHHTHSHFFACAHAPPTEDDNDAVTASPALTWHTPVGWSEVASPAIPGFRRSPAVRQVRITDSPFPLRDVNEDCHVDEAAEEFITKFYNRLRTQKAIM
ncbi:Ras-associating and dilute domain-containing protein [Actinidia chinensis var. chinensis]|uniref:Ras-associating and dilute domain-containing protein n=1 Tax=Actinidia chinensis var. chinensis TaxID=1590841 RepID=A0A2R6PVU8_ACTCC|nr:Ras-associating and dilute domain-containing protein [Actinidia chinensis var. chinensis]